MKINGFPHCIGHEAIGSVVDVGEIVSRFRKDDNVILSRLKTDGIDAGGTHYSWGESAVNAGLCNDFPTLFSHFRKQADQNGVRLSW